MMSPHIEMVKEVFRHIMSAILETGIVRRFEYIFYFFDEVFWKELVLVFLALIGIPILVVTSVSSASCCSFDGLSPIDSCNNRATERGRDERM